MKTTLLLSAAALVLAGCGQKNTDEPAAGNDVALVSGIDIRYIDESVDPGDDFHAYVNGKWIAQTEIPADKPSYGVFTMLHEDSQEQVRAIIDEAASGDFEQGSDEQKVGDLYYSYLDMETRNERGLAPLTAEFEKIDAIADHDDLAVYMAEVNKVGYSMPFTLQQYVDFKDPGVYMMYTWQGGLGLPDREYYFDDSDKGAAIRAAYKTHVATMLELAGIEGAAGQAEAIYALEERMAREHMKKELTRDFTVLYNKLPPAELETLMPKFNWDGYLQTAGIAGIDGVVVTMLDHMKALDEIIADTGIDAWKPYLKWVAVNSNASTLNEELDRQNFEFYSKTLLGTEEQQPPWRRAVNTVNANLGEIVGREYVRRHFPPEAKARMRELVENLIAAYDVSIRELDWMTEATKAEALDKLSKFQPKIGYPDNWRDYSALQIERDDLFGNLHRSARFQYEYSIERQGGPVDRSEWQMTPQTVNAYYNPPLNEIVFPAAILQPPFFNMEADDAVNYGAIGAVIGHEIGHGFDDSGSTFDGDGVLRNWWTDEDRKEFERRTGKLVEQYSAFRPFEDLALNGEYTLGENIGDLGGLGIGLLAYQLSLNGEEPPVIDGFTGVQRVFLGYAQAWRSKYREAALRQQISTDPHSPAKYRTNGVVRNVAAFYEAFDVAADDELYLPPEERVKIW
ncbi:MAG: M13-type metalloendopeptidase [Pseudomonadota bacterium]